MGKLILNGHTTPTTVTVISEYSSITNQRSSMLNNIKCLAKHTSFGILIGISLLRDINLLAPSSQWVSGRCHLEIFHSGCLLFLVSTWVIIFKDLKVESMGAFF